jgi:hypothetical protein
VRARAAAAAAAPARAQIDAAPERPPAPRARWRGAAELNGNVLFGAASQRLVGSRVSAARADSALALRAEFQSSYGEARDAADVRTLYQPTVDAPVARATAESTTILAVDVRPGLAFTATLRPLRTGLAPAATCSCAATVIAPRRRWSGRPLFTYVSATPSPTAPATSTSRLPTTWSGVAHVLEHMFFKGTPRAAWARSPSRPRRGRLPQRAHHLRPHELLRGAPGVGLREGLDIQADAYAESSWSTPASWPRSSRSSSRRRSASSTTRRR